MVLTLKYLKKLSTIFTVVLFLFIAKITQQFLLSFDAITCNFDDKITCEQKRNILNFINLDNTLKTSNICDIPEIIKNNFKFIKSANAFLQTNGILEIQLSCLEPKILVNNTQIIAENLDILDKNLFIKKSLDACNEITVKNIETCALTENCKLMFTKLDKTYFEQFNIIRESEFETLLQDKNNEKFQIIFNDNEAINNQLLQLCFEIKNDLLEKGEFNKKKAKSWIADIRFKDQIVLYAK